MKKKLFDDYAREVAKLFHLTLDQMFSKERRRDIVDARQILYFICMERPIRLSYIQRFMEENGLPVTHSTIIHGYKKAKDLIHNDPDYARLVKQIQNMHVDEASINLSQNKSLSNSSSPNLGVSIDEFETKTLDVTQIKYKGIVGEYYVLAQLIARGYDAALTLGNTKGVDILVMNNKINKGFKIEVKTTTNKSSNEKLFDAWHNNNPCYHWILSKKNELFVAENLIYCFVHISDISVMPKFYLVRSKDVADYVRSQHEFYLSTRKKKVSDTSMRKFRIEINDPNKYENNWSLLEN